MVIWTSLLQACKLSLLSKHLKGMTLSQEGHWQLLIVVSLKAAESRPTWSLAKEHTCCALDRTTAKA